MSHAGRIVSIKSSKQPVEFGNHLPVTFIAGPCVLESRAHALECATALAEIAGRLGV
ncbi:MAG: hypothetical protein KDA48_14255, partial [Amphiplicatus sp.]|nr:hypothetical protein [Amphiplicatus sp.]